MPIGPFGQEPVCLGLFQISEQEDRKIGTNPIYRVQDEYREHAANK
jgi:hypothetical protein